MFSDEIIRSLDAPLNRANVKERKQGGRNLSYIEAWHAIAEANRIFGFDGWSRETLELRCVAEGPREIGENKVPGFGVTYICRVRITAGDVVHDGCGAGHGIDRDLGLAHESALKEAESDAMKRALSCFGNQFGLALYDKEQRDVVDESELQRAARARSFIEHGKASANEYSDRTELLTWWNSAGQKASRDRYQLNAAELHELKAHVIDLADKLAGGANVASS